MALAQEKNLHEPDLPKMKRDSTFKQTCGLCGSTSSHNISRREAHIPFLEFSKVADFHTNHNLTCMGDFYECLEKEILSSEGGHSVEEKLSSTSQKELVLSRQP